MVEKFTGWDIHPLRESDRKDSMVFVRASDYAVLEDRIRLARALFAKLLHASLEDPVPPGFWAQVETWIADPMPGPHNVASTNAKGGVGG